MENLINIEHIISEVSQNKKRIYQQQLENIKNYTTTLLSEKWKSPKRFLSDKRNQFPGVSNKTGVYMIIHQDCEGSSPFEIFYVGQGNIGNRKNVHKAVFLNKGNPRLFYKDLNDPKRITSQADSVIARKMYRRDPNPDNWFFTYIVCSKDWATEIEDKIISELLPEGNDEKMSGKG